VPRYVFVSNRIAQFKKNGYFYAVKILRKDEMIRLRQVVNIKDLSVHKHPTHDSLMLLLLHLQK